jgi:septum formation protein
MSNRLVLASSSPYRQALLAAAGVHCEAVQHRVDESLAVGPVQEMAVAMARAKALSVQSEYPDAHILGSDQLVELDGEAIGKPHSFDVAAGQLHRLQGRTHRLVSAVALVGPGASLSEHCDIHEMTMRSLGSDEIDRYIEKDHPLDCAGSYKIEALGIALFERVNGDDFSAIQGLPMMAVASMLRSAGFQLP